MLENSYVRKARAFPYTDAEGDIYIIAQIDLGRGKVEHDLNLTRAEEVDVKPIRLGAFTRQLDDEKNPLKFDLVYCAENPEQVRQILEIFLSGRAYNIAGMPVRFKRAKEPLPPHIASHALNLIRSFQAVERHTPVHTNH